MAVLDEERVAPRFVPVARRAVELARLRAEQRALAIGAGTGPATLLPGRSARPCTASWPRAGRRWAGPFTASWRVLHAAGPA